MRNPKGCWLECAAAALALFCALGLNINAFSVYIPYLTDALALNPAQSAGFITVRNLFTTGAVYCAKYYYQKLDVRVGYPLAVLLCPVSLLLYAHASGFPTLCVAAALSGICYGLGGMYPVAILLHRWFPRHESVAMGICAASSGLAATIGAPILTRLIEVFSLSKAMYWEILFLLVCCVVCFALLRNYPKNYQAPAVSKAVTKAAPFRVDLLCLAILSIGIMGGGYSYLTVHYTKEGFSPYQVSAIVAVIGLFLIGSKSLLGELTDLWGGYRANWIFHSLTIVSCLLFGLGSAVGYPTALFAACLFGIGDAIASVGVSIYARDLGAPEAFAATQRQYQFLCMLGVLISSVIPGVAATFTGNYRLYYVVCAVVMVFAMAVIQSAYAKKGKHISHKPKSEVL